MFSAPLRWRAAAFGLILGCVATATLLFAPGPLTNLRSVALDKVITSVPLSAGAGDLPIIVVDIGRLDEAGQPWSRAASARLLHQIAEPKPRLVAADIVFSGDCNVGPVAQDLASAIQSAPTLLGALISREASPAPLTISRTAVSAGVAEQLWAAAGLEAPCPAFQAASSGLGVVSLPAEGGATVRHVPAAVVAGGEVHTSLPVEAMRQIDGVAVAMIGEGSNGGTVLRLGKREFPLETGGMLRFVPSDPAVWAGRTIAAAEVLTGGADARLRDAVVFIGSSLPQRGGLRPTASDALHPSVQIAADMLGGLVAGSVPYRPTWATRTEAAALALMTLATMVVVVRASPMWAIGAAVGTALVYASGTLAIYRGSGILIDPSLPVLGYLLASFCALAYQAAGLWRAEAALRYRMGQILPKHVVTRLAQTPGLLRVKGEAREVVTMFTDLEGFSAMVNRVAPEVVIGHLDAYFGLLTDVILRHGGMVDKIVGDGVHALFNAPLDLHEPVEAALRAAAEIISETEKFRAMPDRDVIGRTRVGIEYGPVVLGDVGSGAKIDYTAHGPAVNLAARLQELARGGPNAVIIGPEAAMRSRRALPELGLVDVRSFGALRVYTLPKP